MHSIFSHTVKKTLIYLALAGAASWGALVPTLAQAGFFDALLPRAAAQATPGMPAYTSATMPLPTPAKNINPKTSSQGGDTLAVVAGEALAPQTGPSGTAADIAQRPESTQISVHVVRPGENISTIAEMYGVSANTVKWANDLQSGVIHAGQELVILPVNGVPHTVAKGDTVASIAKKYNADEDEIRAHNDIAGGLVIGGEILVPNGTIAAAPAPVRASGASSGGGAAASSGLYIRPVSGKLTQGIHGNNGVDIGAAKGTPVYASAAGKVIVARTGWNGGYGNYVVVQHSRSQTLYAHLSSISVSSGQSVVQGQKIGAVGNSGKVIAGPGGDGSHLHFEVVGAANPFAR